MNDPETQGSGDEPQCDECGYTEADAKLHGDHYLCGSVPPWAQGAGDARGKESRMSETRVRRIRKAIDAWARSKGHGVRAEEHDSLAVFIHEAIASSLSPPIARKGILLDVDAAGDYCNPRIVDWEGAEETLHPLDPETDEAVAEAVAHYALTLPHADSVPDI